MDQNIKIEQKENSNTENIIKALENNFDKTDSENMKKRLIISMEQVDKIRAKLKGEDKNTTITLKDCIDIVDGFINNTVSIDELENFGTKMSIRVYIPILEKMTVLMKILMEYEVSDVESTEIKMIELYKHIFYTVVLGLYGQIQIDPIKDKELMTYENYDKLFPIFYQYIIGYCKIDYDVFMSMFNDCINWNGVVRIAEGLEQIDSDKLEETTKKNQELIENLKENTELVSDMKDILLANDSTTKQVVENIKEKAIKDVMKKEN